MKNLTEPLIWEGRGLGGSQSIKEGGTLLGTGHLTPGSSTGAPQSFLEIAGQLWEGTGAGSAAWERRQKQTMTHPVLNRRSFPQKYKDPLT